MKSFLPKLAVLGVVAGGFYATGDLPRLIDRGRRITERTSVPFPASEPVVGPPTHVASSPPSQPVQAAAAVPPALPPRIDSPQPVESRDDPTRIPMPPLALEAVDLASLQAGQRVLLLCGKHVVALDVVDGPAGEVLEHAHECHSDRTVTIASTAAPRRLVVVGCSSGSPRLAPRAERRIVHGEWLHVLPSGGTPTGRAAPATETIGPIEAIGLD